MVEGNSTPKIRSDRVVFEANPNYWDKTRFPRLKRIIFDNTLKQKEAGELVKTREGRVDLVTQLSPLETLRVAQSPFAKVVKERATLGTMFGLLNMRKAESPWQDVRLRRAVNYAINRADLIRYAAKGNGVIIPALIPPRGLGFDPDLAPYPFDPGKAQQLLREAGYPDGLAMTLITPQGFEVQATVISKMLEHVGFMVERQVLDTVSYNQQVTLSHLGQSSEQQQWDIALTKIGDFTNFSLFAYYHIHAVEGYRDWVDEQPELRQLYAQVLGTVDREHQQALLRQMERHTRDQAYFLFLYSPIQLYAGNKAVEFVPYADGMPRLVDMTVTEQHWSVRKQKEAVQK